MKMYHGTYMIVDTIDLTKSRNRVDFGKGFYLTDKVGTAQSCYVRVGAGSQPMTTQMIDRIKIRPCRAYLIYQLFRHRPNRHDIHSVRSSICETVAGYHS